MNNCPSPDCRQPNIIYRSWKDDYLCGWCGRVYSLVGAKLIEKVGERRWAIHKSFLKIKKRREKKERKK